ncbi:class I SAM-dependent methyltransferase [Candidatus Daviesbacteria bacterium]|nr:class I SAM-dependent methyltransferase [Candidatus Daviesbacteria bacterium]
MNDKLSKLALKYKADKCPQIKHGYTPYYFKLLKDMQFTVKKVLEIGAGEGASLRMWRDFFPNAQIYGAEIDPKRIFTDGRIKVIKCDQSSKKDLVNLITRTGSDIDLVIDDGSHIPQDQVFSCLTLMPLLKKDVIYIIEDVADPTIEKQLTGYELEIPELVHTRRKYDDRLIVVRHKSTTDTYQYVLKKYNISPDSGSFIEIPNVGRNNLAELFAELKFNKGAEIGVNVGHYSEILCKANPNLHLYSIDPWKISSYGPDVVPAEVGIVKNQEAFEANRKEAEKRLSAYNCTIIQKDSLTAAKDFADNSLDFVYIDANHEFLNIAQDLHTWKKKVRLGGILSGDDYENFNYTKKNHVKQVVQVYMPSYNMLPCFILGSRKGKERGEFRDRIRSWFWVKR